MAANEYRQMHPRNEEDEEEAPFHLLQTNSNVNIGVRFIEPESQYAMDPNIAEQTSNLMAANEYRSMHPIQEYSEEAPFHLVQTDFAGVDDEEIDNDKFAGELAQTMEANEAKTHNFSQIDTTDDFGHLYDESPALVQTRFVTESAQDAIDPSLPYRYAQMMNYNENRALIPDDDAYDPSKPIHLVQTGFLSGAENDDMSLSTATAKGMEEYEHRAMTQSNRFNDEDMRIWKK